MTNVLMILTDEINNFDSFYFMSDSSKVYNFWNSKEHEIMTALEACTGIELNEIYNNLTDLKKVSKCGLVSYLKENLEVPAVESPKVSIFKTAWTYLKSGLISTMSAALKMAWNRYKLLSKLRTGIAAFTFIKADGTVRDAVGTLKLKTSHTATTEKKVNLEIVKYFDTMANGWRSLRLDSLITIAA